MNLMTRIRDRRILQLGASVQVRSLRISESQISPTSHIPRPTSHIHLKNAQHIFDRARAA